MTITIMGYGVVGRAVEAMLRMKGARPELYDPPQGRSADLDKTEVAFICVPAPTDFQEGTMDITAVESCVRQLRPGTIAIIRSTVLPGTTNRLQQDHPDKHLYFAPEFLTEATAEADALAPTRVIIGVPLGGNIHKPLARVRSLMGAAEAPVLIMSSNAAEAAKYAANTFYAVKVAFFNQLFDLCEVNGINYESVREAVAADPWTGAQHTDIFHGGYRGYGGKCLPKDIRAFSAWARMMGAPQALMETAEAINHHLREMK